MDEITTSSPAFAKPPVGSSPCQTYFKDVAHYYLRCPLIHRWSNRNESEPIFLDASRLKLGVSDWIPVLRKLSQITIYEAAKVMQMVFHPNAEYPITDYKLKINDAGNAVVYLSNDWYEEDLTFGNSTGSIWSVNRYSHTIKVGANVHHYLLSNGFDLFNLIDNGEAVC